jgi:cell division protein FtsB
MARAVAEETLYLREQRRFRRLEASLPVWLANAQDFDRPNAQPWSLGYTRDISMGGAKVFVATGEEDRWRACMTQNARCVLRFDVPGVSDEEYVSGAVRHVARDAETGNCWLGVEFDEEAERTRAEVMKAGLKSVHQRRRLQLIVVLAFLLIGLGGFVIQGLAARNNQLRAQIAEGEARLGLLSRPGQVGTRAEGINALFESEDLQSRLARLKKLNDPKNAQIAEAARLRDLKALGISNAPLRGAQVTLGVAWPYGFAWPQVTRDLEEVLGRSIPVVVTFRDFKAPFPLVDCREARVRGKILQITWEPWYFSNPKAVKMSDIAAGKWDKYIDSWANGARSFGGELHIRFAHEFNGNWYPWSVPANRKNAALYVKAYRRVHDRFTRAGADNVRWIWCLNAESVPNASWNDPMRAYPGSDYVDIVSIDGYNFGKALPNSRWQSFTEIYATPYAKVLRHPSARRKPLMIGEIGCATVGGNKAAWMADMDKQLRGPFRKISGVVWFEAAKEADWRMVSSPDSLRMARAIWRKEHYRRGEP